VGDDLIFTDLGAWVGSDGTTDTVTNSAVAGATPTTGSGYTVATVPSTTTFTLNGASGNSMRGIKASGSGDLAGTASTDASEIIAVATSTASASRTTTTDGTASYSWSDTEGTSGLDTITFNPGTASVSDATKAFYRLASSTSSATAGDFTSTDANGTLADTETHAMLVEWDGTNNDFIVKIVGGASSVATNPVTQYKQYTFDANDHFATEGIVSGAIVANGGPVTMAAWETAMGTEALTAGVANDIVYIDYGTGLSTDINRFTMDAG
jgi:hypothetical protein